MTYEEALTAIHAFPRFNGAPTLERMRALMALLGDPQEKLSVVHIAGTNGKGSTAAMCASIFRAAGYRTGLTISPFILDFCERIQVDGAMISREALAEEAASVLPLAEQVGGVTEFEVVTAMAFDWFCRQGCELVVAEVGLGGRFDATNIITRPLICAITSIGLDHTAILGDTLAQIAFEKAGIIKSGVPVVTLPGQSPEALAVLMEQCAEKGCELLCPGLNAAQDIRLALDGTEFTYDGLELHLPLAGQFQVRNALTALTASARVLERLGVSPERRKAALVQGLDAVRFPARMEVLCRAPLTILDGAHNPDGAAALAQALSLAGERPLTAVMGMLSDKDSGAALEILAPHFRRVLCVTPQNLRALDAHALAARADALGLSASAAHSAEEAWELAAAVAAAEGGAVVICGSLYLAAELRAIIVKK